nr:hypothetical protein [Halomonas lionensis]
MASAAIKIDQPGERHQGKDPKAHLAVQPIRHPVEPSLADNNQQNRADQDNAERDQRLAIYIVKQLGVLPLVFHQCS